MWWCRHTIVLQRCNDLASSGCVLSLLQKTGRQPDFKKRQQDRGKDAVWLDDRRLPAWVKKNLDKLPGGQPFPTPSFIPDSAANGTDKERAWVELFSNYSAFWDNRLNVSVLGCVQCVCSRSSIGSATCANVMGNSYSTMLQYCVAAQPRLFCASVCTMGVSLAVCKYGKSRFDHLLNRVFCCFLRAGSCFVATSTEAQPSRTRLLSKG